MQRAVERGLAAKPRSVPDHIGVDEKAAGKGQDYITVVSDLDTATVEYIADERRRASLDSYFEKFSATELDRVKAVAMDMWGHCHIIRNVLQPRRVRACLPESGWGGVRIRQRCRVWRHRAIERIGLSSGFATRWH